MANIINLGSKYTEPPTIPEEKIFIVTAGSTTYAQVTAALAANKIPILYDKSKALYGTMLSGMMYAAGTSPSRNYYTFAALISGDSADSLSGWHNPGFKYFVLHNDDTWDLHSPGSSDVIITSEKLQTTLNSSTYPPTSAAVSGALASKVNTSALADVATSGSYNDLKNKPTTMKNPNSLSITVDGTTTTYDGSTARNITLNTSSTSNIPYTQNVSYLTTSALAPGGTITDSVVIDREFATPLACVGFQTYLNTTIVLSSLIIGNHNSEKRVFFTCKNVSSDSLPVGTWIAFQILYMNN